MSRHEWRLFFLAGLWQKELIRYETHIHSRRDIDARRVAVLVFKLNHQIYNQGLTIWSFLSVDVRQRLSLRLPSFRDA